MSVRVVWRADLLLVIFWFTKFGFRTDYGGDVPFACHHGCSDTDDAGMLGDSYASLVRKISDRERRFVVFKNTNFQKIY